MAGQIAPARPSAHDLELAALAAAGDRAAYGELVRRHSASVRGLLRRMGAEPSLADDVAQDAFLAGFEQVAAFRGSGTFRAWIGQIAARQFVRRRRRDGRLTALADVEETAAGGGGENGAAQRIDLDEALKTLSEPERLCVSMCYGAGLSHQEVAELLNTPLGTVKSHVKRGLDKLRSRLSPDGAPATERKLHG
jgi:RNA polymerase sigma factor (sigma-70 family)